MWADAGSWFQSPAGMRVVQGAVVPALAILVAGVVAALIGRAAAGAVLRAAERDRAVAVVAALVEAARVAALPDGPRSERRRAARLRTEADVRCRLLSLPGAALAAAWAERRTDDVAAGATQGDPSAAIADLRGRLTDWVRAPRRAKRLFAAAPAPAPERRRRQRADRRQEPSATQGPRGGKPERAAEPQRLDIAVAAVPAATRAAPEQEPRTAPVAVQQVRPASDSRASAPDEAGRSEAAAATVRRPQRPARAEAVPPADPDGDPAWLDSYDDEAQVTQNMDLRTPPPVAATQVRDRAPEGSDIVPRG